MKIARLPHGPTLTFQIHSYSLTRDIVSAMKKQFVFEKLYQNAPLIVMNSFSGEGLHMKVMASMFQNMFPTINITKVRNMNLRKIVTFFSAFVGTCIWWLQIYACQATFNMSTSSANVVTTVWARMTKESFLDFWCVQVFLIVTVSKPTIGHSWFPMHWVLGALSVVVMQPWHMLCTCVQDLKFSQQWC
jgi:ribosome biogenesis protein SSF1/2